MPEVDRKQPAIIGGLIVGVLSILPIISAGNFCCCLWALVGGIVAAKLLVDRSPQPVKSGDGATIGLLAGVVGGAIHVVIGVPLNLLMQPLNLRFLESMSNITSDPQFQQMMERIIEGQRHQPLAQSVVITLVFAIVFAIVLAGFTTLGGLLGVALFEKRKDNLPPPPQYPPQYPPSYPSTPPPPPSAPPGEGGER